MCACLPAVRALLVRIMPRVLGFSSNRSAGSKYADGRASSGAGAAARHGASGLYGSEDRKSSTAAAGKAVATGDGPYHRHQMDYVTRARRRGDEEDSSIELEDMSDGGIDHASLNKDDVVLVGRPGAVQHDRGVP